MGRKSRPSKNVPTIEDVDFIDAEAYISQFQQGLSFKQIVLNHFNRIALISSKEMRGGYFENKPTLTGGGIQITKKYIEDGREAYCNSVDVLFDMLYPFFDKEMDNEGEKSEEEFEQLIRVYKTIMKKTTNKESMQNQFKNEKLKIKRKLFRELSCFLYRERYLEMKSYEEVI